MLVLLSLLTSILDSFSNLLNKKTANKISDLNFVWLTSLCTLPFFIVGYFIFGLNKAINIDPNFFLILGVGVITLFGARILLRKAFDTSDLSLVSPIKGFTPIFSLIIGIFVLNEVPSTLGYIGIFCIFLGSLISNYKALSKVGFSLKKILTLQGVYLTIISDIFYSVYFLDSKLGSQQVAIFPWLIMLHGIIAGVFFIELGFKRKLDVKTLLPAVRVMSLYAIFNSFSIIISLFLISQIYLAYYTSLMQIYILVDVFLGHFVLKENGFINRLAGTAVIFVGLIMVGMFG